MSRRSLPLGGLVACLAAALALAGCGAPTSGMRPYEADNVPYELLSPSPTPTPTGDTTASSDVATEVWFTDDEDLLVPITTPAEGGTRVAQVNSLLDRLTAGPDEAARDLGLGSALGPDITLRAVRIANGTAFIDLAAPTREPTADQIPLAVGQIVLTATSVDGVLRVALLTDGERVDIPLPGGQQTSVAVTAMEYATLVNPEG